MWTKEVWLPAMNLTHSASLCPTAVTITIETCDRKQNQCSTSWGLVQPEVSCGLQENCLQPKQELNYARNASLAYTHETEWTLEKGREETRGMNVN